MSLSLQPILQTQLNNTYNNRNSEEIKKVSHTWRLYTEVRVEKRKAASFECPRLAGWKLQGIVVGTLIGLVPYFKLRSANIFKGHRKYGSTAQFCQQRGLLVGRKQRSHQGIIPAGSHLWVWESESEHPVSPVKFC